MEKRTEQKNFRLTLSEASKLEEMIKLTGMSLSDLVAEKILNNNSNQELTDLIEWESEQLQEKIEDNLNYQKSFTNEFREAMKALSYQITKASDKSAYSFMNELALTEDRKKNIYEYKKGDFIRTAKNHVLIITAKDEAKNEIKVSLFPLVANPQYQVWNVKEKYNDIVQVYRQ